MMSMHILFQFFYFQAVYRRMCKWWCYMAQEQYFDVASAVEEMFTWTTQSQIFYSQETHGDQHG